MNIRQSRASGVPTAHIEMIQDERYFKLEFRELDVAWGGKRKIPVIDFDMVPGKAADRKNLLQIINIFMEHDPKFAAMIREYGHQKTLDVK